MGRDAATDRAAVRRCLGVVFQQPALDKELTASENLRCHGRLLGLGRREVASRSAELLETVGLGDKASEPAKRLSGGQRRRVELCKAMLAAPPVLLMDEPTVGLDPAARRDAWRLVADLRAASPTPTTVLVSTHLMDDLGPASADCDRLVLLDAGRVVADAPPAELVAGVGGDVVTLVPDRPEDAAKLADFAASRFGLDPASVSAVGGTVRIERGRGQELVADLFADRGSLPVPLREATVGRPTLEDAYLRLTGRGLGG